MAGDGGCFKIRGSAGGEGGVESRGGGGVMDCSDHLTAHRGPPPLGARLYLPTVIIIRGILTAIQTILNLRTKNAAQIFA